MGKALVIKNTDFSTNKLATITFGDIPCIGLSLNKASTTISDSETLVATPVPANTTDTVLWSSSDTTVATVENGVVTAVSSGSATITATCGNQTATCSVTVSIVYAFTKDGMLKVNTSGAHTLIDNAGVITGNRISMGKASGSKHAYGMATESETLIGIYPISIPSGAKTITVSPGPGLASLIVYYNKNEEAEDSRYLIRSTASVVGGETPSGGTDWSISSYTYGDRTFTIPDIEGLNSFTLAFEPKTTSDYNNFDPTNPGITITFGFTDPE